MWERKKAHLLGFGSGAAWGLAGQASTRGPVSRARRGESEALRKAGPMEGRALAILPFVSCPDEGARAQAGGRLEQHVGCSLSRS